MKTKQKHVMRGGLQPAQCRVAAPDISPGLLRPGRSLESIRVALGTLGFQPSLTRRISKPNTFPALKGRAKFMRRYAASCGIGTGVNVETPRAGFGPPVSPSLLSPKALAIDSVVLDLVVDDPFRGTEQPSGLSAVAARGLERVLNEVLLVGCHGFPEGDLRHGT
jgi:hypothetical protein